MVYLASTTISARSNARHEGTTHKLGHKTVLNINGVQLQAVTVLRGDSDVSGTVTFHQSSPVGPVTISGELKNLEPLKKQGFHIQCVDVTARRRCLDFICKVYRETCLEVVFQLVLISTPSARITAHLATPKGT